MCRGLAPSNCPVHATHAGAAQAKEKLNGYGYDHLILKVDWAEPSKQKNPGMDNGMKYASGYGKALPQGL